LTQEYHIKVGFSNMQNLPYLGEDRENPPGIGIGLDYFLPRVKSSASKQRGGIKVSGVVTEDGLPMRTVIDSSWHKAQERQLLFLRDSLRMSSTEIEHLNRMVEHLEQRNQVLEDSVAALQLARHVSDAQINQALKHLSRSLRLFYNEEYEDALIEINEALEYNPNLALAYARRGSIYYKLNQIDRATINWNIALQIDPGYDEVRNILRALNENRLRSAVSARD
jgi:tetratricopeptide (TPR) repeat protein